jgi:hypothetical protein
MMAPFFPIGRLPSMILDFIHSLPQTPPINYRTTPLHTQAMFGNKIRAWRIRLA